MNSKPNQLQQKMKQYNTWSQSAPVIQSKSPQGVWPHEVVAVF